MGVFSKPKTKYVTKDAEDEKDTTRAVKQRLTETEGEHEGQLLNKNQGKTVRKIFG